MRRGLVTLAILLASARAHADDARTYPGASAILVDPLVSPYRVHVARMTEVSLVPGGAPSSGGGHDLDDELELPVAEERGARVRVMIEHDDARTLVWIAEDDLAWSLTKPVRLRGRGDAGVWLTTGAPVTIAGKGRRRTMTHHARGVEVTGALVPDAVGRVFPVPNPFELTWGAPARELRVAPGGAMLQRGPLEVQVLTRRGAWTEAEFRSRYARVRGWVASSRIELGLFVGGGTGSGSSFAISDVDRVAVPAGACLFDEQDGQLVGVQLADARRYVSGREGDWWRVWVGTPWGTVLAWAHATDDVDGTPQWERCADLPRSP